jgi:hypothetical protein
MFFIKNNVLMFAARIWTWGSGLYTVMDDRL